MYPGLAKGFWALKNDNLEKSKIQVLNRFSG